MAGAGELKAQNGWIEWLSNKSGHYAPSITHMVQVLHILQKKGVPMTFRLSALSRAGKKDYPTVTAFLTEIEADGEPDYDLMKLFAYSAHLTDAVLNPNGWRWRIPSEEPGVHVIATGQLVPHKTVRQWLKAQGLFATKEVQSGAAR